MPNFHAKNKIWLKFTINYSLFYDVHKENMFTINLEDGREAPSKASIDIYI